MRSQVKYIEALGVCDQRVGSVLQEKAHDVVMTSLNGPHCRSGIRFAAFGIEFCSSIDEVLAQCVMVIYGCPLKTPMH